MKQQLFLILIFILPVYLYGQSAGKKGLKAKVINQQTGKPLIYANIYNLNTDNGTLSDHNGFFSLPQYNPGDSVKISYIGFYDTTLSNKDVSYETIALRPKVELLSEVLVFADSDYLYSLLAKIRRNYMFSNAIELPSKVRSGKTYYQLETYCKGQRTELLEAYYNGEFSPYEIDKLHIKKGRAGIKPLDSNIYITSETSKTFYLHKLFYKNEHFPINPLQLNKRKLKKHYSLKLTNAFNEQKNKILQIKFIPKEHPAKYFTGTVWVDIKNLFVKKIKLNAIKTNRHPFLAFGNIKEISQVDMSITKTFQLTENEVYVKSIDFNYDLQCNYKHKKTRKYSTRAVIQAYNYYEQFNLPFFEFSKSLHQDYRNISALPYDTTFWEQTKEFAMHMNSEAKREFIEQHSIQIKRPPLKTLSPKSSIHDFFYRPWQTKRLSFKDMTRYNPDQRAIIKKNGLEHPTTNYFLNTKLYLDYVLMNDSVWFTTKTLIDPVGTFDEHELTRETKAFINMYFDLLEITRRDLIEDLKSIKHPDINKITQLYNKHLTLHNKTIKKFISDVHHGETYDAMRLWNRVILEKTGVNNIEKYKLFESLEKEILYKE